jgi:hypothetical protein
MNASYVPGLPLSKEDLLLRRDMRWGPDDPTLWLHEYSEMYCHLGVVPWRPSALDSHNPTRIMFWNPTRDDFVSADSGKTVTCGLGKLDYEQTHHFSLLVNDLLDRCKVYTSTFNPPAQPNPLIDVLSDSLRCGLVRLQTIPATFERMVLGVTISSAPTWNSVVFFAI